MNKECFCNENFEVGVALLKEFGASLQLLDAYFSWVVPDNREYTGVVDSAKELLRTVDVVHVLTTNNITFRCEEPHHSVKGAFAVGHEEDEHSQRYYMVCHWYVEFGRFIDEDRIKCPCIKCRNIPYRDTDTVKHHLYKSGFVEEYWFWDKHGETSIDDDNTFLGVDDSNKKFNESECSYREMVIDAMAPNFNTINPKEEPNVLDKKFFDMLAAADKELWC
uniref:Transposase-associated domain-containing protein n=1 Tax=Lactuca sativa TaxID=4236 RepID=A0A9R1VBP4_LACSA|nr:hypothetical protein LSAT_V11C600321320 [Lactuca sativa]